MSWWQFPNARKLVNRLQKLEAKLKAVVREYAARASPEGENVGRALGCKFGNSDRVRVGSEAETIGEEQDVAVASTRDRQGGEVIDADDNAGPFG